MKKYQLVKNMMRSIFAAPKEKSIFCADFSSIEARVVLWMADEEGALETLRSGRDIYIEMAKEINPEEPDRQLGKQIILGAGFGMGHIVFMTTCQGYGMEVDEYLAKKAISTYKKTYPGVPRIWKGFERAFLDAMETGSASVRGVLFKKETMFGRMAISMYLYSGRKIIYWEPRLAPGKYGPEIRSTFRISGGAMYERKTWGGDIFQDFVQGTARDMMCYGSRQAGKAGFEIFATVHDEALGLGDSDRDLDDFITAFAQKPSWAKGCPVEASGWKGQYYRKD